MIAPGETVPAPSLRVTQVRGGSQAAKAGVARGDYVAQYDGQTLHSRDDLIAAGHGDLDHSALIKRIDPA